MSAAPQARAIRRDSPAFVYGAWLAYSLLIGWLALYHEPWRDEVKALSIARSGGSMTDLLHLLHVEGHPPLWYLLLKIAYGLFHTTAVLPVCAWTIASAGAYIFLRCSPFSRAVKMLFLLGMCPLYEYAVISREYGMALPLLFTLCAKFDQRLSRPGWVYGSLALLAAGSIYGAIIAMAFSAVFIVEAAQQRAPLRYYAWPVLAGLCIALDLWLALPDSQSNISGFSTVANHTFCAAAISAALVCAMLIVKRDFFLHSPWIRKAVIMLTYTATTLGILLSGNIFPFAFYSGGLIPSSLWLFAFFAYLLPRPPLVFILGSVTTLYVLIHLYVYPMMIWHQEMLYVLVIALLWIDKACYPAVAPGGNPKALADDIIKYRRKLFPKLFAVFLAFQVFLGVICALEDVQYPYSASGAVARFIQKTPALHDAILIGEPDFLLEPMPYYLDNPLYFPRGKRFGQWTSFSHRVFAEHMTLGELLDQARQLQLSTGKPVLIFLKAKLVAAGKAGKDTNSYGRVFEWSADDSRRLYAQTRFLGEFDNALIDENYDVYELSPLTEFQMRGKHVRRH